MTPEHIIAWTFFGLFAISALAVLGVIGYVLVLLFRGDLSD